MRLPKALGTSPEFLDGYRSTKTCGRPGERSAVRCNPSSNVKVLSPDEEGWGNTCNRRFTSG